MRLHHGLQLQTAGPECQACRPLTNARLIDCVRGSNVIYVDRLRVVAARSVEDAAGRRRPAASHQSSACRSAAPAQPQVPAGGATGTAAPPQPRRSRATAAAPLCSRAAAMREPP